MDDLKQKLSNVYWIGGSPCAGKTTLAKRLVDEYDFKYYKCDIYYDDHMSRSNPNEHPTMYKIKDFTWNEVWSTRFCSISIEQQIHEVYTVYLEQFQLILEDLLSLPETSNILVEGAALLPEKVAPLLTRPNQAIWFVPGPDFQVEQYANREWINIILEQYDDPIKAFSNWMSRDIGYAHKITEGAQKLNLKTVKVDGTQSIEQNYKALIKQFSL